jgi:4-amino-4-deoxy-L-arabinose transferase-like glycosyltransferase
MTNYVYRHIPHLLLLALCLIIGVERLDQITVNQGLRATYNRDSAQGIPPISRIEKLITVNSNDHYGSYNGSIDVKWEGYLWSNKKTTIYLSVPEHLNAHLELNGQTVISSISNKQGQLKRVQTDLAQGLNPIMFHLSHPDIKNTFYSGGLKWETLTGSRLIPTKYLFPSSLNDDHALIAVASRYLQDFLTWTTVLIIGIIVFTILFQYLRSCTDTEKIFLISVVILAFILRFIYLNNLIVNLAGFDALPNGSDQLVYEADARDLMRGLWPGDIDFYRQPGFTWLLGTLHLILGDSLRLFQGAQIFSGSLSSIAIYFLGKNIFNLNTARISTIIWATFPLLIFYDAQLLTHAIEAHLTIWILCAWWSTITSKNCMSITHSNWIICALLVGIASVIRPGFIALLPLILISIKLQLGTSKLPIQFAKLSALVAITFIPILPVTYHNYQHSGQLQLFSANGPVTLYLGNNRDSAGIGQYSPAFLATHELVNRGQTTFFKQTTNDILENPQRWFGLMTRKTALYWGNLEISNNVDFYAEGTNISLLLQYLPIRFGALVVLAFTGIQLSVTKPNMYQPGKWLILSIIGVLCITTVMFHVVSRFRVPTYGPLILFSAFALTEITKQLISRDAQRIAKSIGVITISGILVLTLPYIADNSVPLPTERHVPKDSIVDKLPFGSELTLESHSLTTTVEPGEPIFVNLYWSINDPIIAEYYGSVQLLSHNGDKITQTDHKLGGGSFPYHTSISWETDDIVRDEYLLSTPKALTTPIALDVLVAVYDKQTDNRIGEAIIDRLAITSGSTLTMANTASSVNASLGPVSLNGFDHEIHDDTLSLTLYWISIEKSSVDGVIFIHIYDENNNFIIGHDSPPIQGSYPMGLWQPGEGIIDTHQIPIEELSNSKHSLQIGIYDPTSGARLNVVDNTGNNVLNNSLHLLDLDIH